MPPWPSRRSTSYCSASAARSRSMDSCGAVMDDPRYVDERG
jgi:hypothetical protein